MTQWQETPRLDELLADPIIQAAMRADGVEPAALRSLMKSVKRRTTAPQIRLVAEFRAGPHDAVADSFVRGTLPFAGDSGMAAAARESCAFCW